MSALNIAINIQKSSKRASLDSFNLRILIKIKPLQRRKASSIYLIQLMVNIKKNKLRICILLRVISNLIFKNRLQIKVIII